MIMIHMCFQYFLLFTMAFASAELDVFPDIESCAYVDASLVRCRWKKPKNEVNYTLSYVTYSDACVKQCYPTEEFISNSQEIYHQCSFYYSYLFTKFKLFLAANCSSTQEIDSCAKCTHQSENMVEFENNETSTLIESPPVNFRKDNFSMTFEWDPPGVGTFLEFVTVSRRIRYKLMYKLLYCQLGDSDGSKVEEKKWKDWYVGEESYYISEDLLPGCAYATRVYASFVDGNWSKGSEVITFQTPTSVYSSFVNGKWSNDSQIITFQTPASVISLKPGIGEVKEVSQDSFLPVVVACVCLSIIIPAVAVLLACWICPEKFKVPKPIIMISSTIPSQDFNFQDGDDDHSTEESVTKLVISKEKFASDVIFLSTPNGGRKIKNNYSSSTKLSLQYLPDIVTDKRHSFYERNLKNKHLSFYDQLDSAEKKNQQEGYLKTDEMLHSRTDSFVIEIPKATEKTVTNYYRGLSTLDHTLLSHSTGELRREDIIDHNHNYKKWLSSHSVSSEVYLSSDAKDSDYVPDVMKKPYPTEDYEETLAKLSSCKEKLLDSLEKEEHTPEYVREFDISPRIRNDSHGFIVINIPTHENDLELYCHCAHIFNKSNSIPPPIQIESVF